MSDEKREKILAKVRRFLSDDEPVNWQRLKAELPHQREWLEANEEIEETFKGMIAGTVEASDATLKEVKAKYDAALEKELLKGLDSGPSIQATPEYWQKLRERLNDKMRRHKEERRVRADHNS